MSNILVTGAAGFLGNAIVEHLRAQKHTVFPIAHRENFYKNLLNITAKNAIDVVVHAGFSVDFSTNSITESENIVTASNLKNVFENKNISHFIFLSAAAVIGVSRDARQRNEENFNTCDPEFQQCLQNNYVKDKILSEKILSDVPAHFCSLYLSTIYGIGMPQSTKSTLFGGTPIFRLVPPGGTSYLILSDFLIALDLVLQKRVQGSYVLNSGNIEYKKLFSLSDEVTKKCRMIITIPPFFAKLISRIPLKGSFISSKSVILSSFGYKYFSPQKAFREFQFQPKGNLKETLIELFAQK